MPDLDFDVLKADVVPEGLIGFSPRSVFSKQGKDRHIALSDLLKRIGHPNAYATQGVAVVARENTSMNAESGHHWRVAHPFDKRAFDALMDTFEHKVESVYARSNQTFKFHELEVPLGRIVQHLGRFCHLIVIFERNEPEAVYWRIESRGDDWWIPGFKHRVAPPGVVGMPLV